MAMFRIDQLHDIATAMEADAGASSPANASQEGLWLRIALAAEDLADAASPANQAIPGYMLRTAVALESLSGTSGVEENATDDGYMKRLVDAAEGLAGGPTDGTMEDRFYTAMLNAEYGPGAPAWVPGGATAFLDIANNRAWTEADGEQPLSAFLTGYNAADITADGLLVDATHNTTARLTGSLVDRVLAYDFHMVIECTVGAFPPGGYHAIFSAQSADTSAQVFIENWNGDFVYIEARGTQYNITTAPFIAPGTPARYGAVVTPTGVTGSVNGSTPVLDPQAPGGGTLADKIFVGNNGSLGKHINGRLRQIVFY